MSRGSGRAYGHQNWSLPVIGSRSVFFLEGADMAVLKGLAENPLSEGIL